MAERFGRLLRSLKETYGWSAIRSMPAQDLIVLLTRSSRSDEDHVAVDAFGPWIQLGLLDLLSAPPRQRQGHWRKLSADLGSPAAVLEASAQRMDRVLALSRADRRDLPTPAAVAADHSPSAPAGRIMPLLIGTGVLGMAAGLALTIQIGRYRQEVIRQQQASREQKAELDRVKRQLSQRDQAAGRSGSESPRRSLAPEALPTPALPEGAPDPPVPEPSPSPTRASGEPEIPRWSGCEPVAAGSGASPQPGDLWWPVVGPLTSLEAVRRHCRADAFRNRDGNTQVASFRDRSAATAFADQLSADPQHPYTFYVGESTRYD